MRQTKHFLLMAAMLLGSLTASAYDFKVDGICYNILSSADLTVEVTSDVNNIKYEGSITIPSRVSLGDKEYKVISVGDRAFCQCFNLSSVSISWGVEEIGQQAFGYCYNLTSITIPSSVTTIGWHAFGHCRSLTSISIPNKVTRIGQGTFRGCEKLTSLTIPASVNTIELWAFENCSALTTIAIPSSVTRIEQQAFAGCSKLASVYSTAAMPPTLGSSVFEEISSSAKLYVPKNSETAYTDAGWSSYFSQVGAISGTCGNSLTWTLCSDGELIVEGTGAMADYSYSSTSPWTQYIDNIKKLTIKDGVTSIGNRAFSECSLLTSASLPEGLTEIGTHAFYYCESLATVNIPSTVTSIGMCAFMYCDFTEISLPKGITKIQNSTFTGTSLKTIEIPEGVTEIGENSFCACKALESITLPSSVTTIGSMAFQYCENLNSVTIPENVTSIGTYVFDGCKSLTSITIPEGVKSISKNAFSDCTNLVSVIISEGVKTIGDYAFSRCENLASVTCLAVTPPTLSSSTFNQISSSAVLYVPGSAINQYKTTNYWKSFSDIRSNITWTLTDEGELIIEGVGKMTDSPWSGKINLIKSVTIKDGVTSICSNAFNYCKSLTSITIPESVIEIGSRAFNGCINLSSITIPKGVTSIGGSTFSDCENLKSISFSENSKLNSIGSYAFYYCVNLASIEIPEGVTSIGTYAFDECVNLTSITIPTTVTEIGNYAFNDCNCIILKCPNIGEWFGQNEAIKEVVLGETVISVGDRAFQYCYNLASLTISESVTHIGNSAFYCTGITSITIPENSKLTSIGGSAFGGCRSISSITCELKTPPTITSTTFANIDKSIPLYVPQPSVSVYQSAPYWNEFSNVIGVIPENQSITISQYGSGTYCSEYALDFSEVQGLKAYAAAGYNTESEIVTLLRVNTSKAGIGLFIKGEPGTTYEVPVMKSSTDNVLNMLVGTLEQTPVNAYSSDERYANFKYTILPGKEEPLFYQFEDGSTLSAGKAYLQIPVEWLPAMETRSIGIRFDEGDGTTDMEQFTIDNSQLTIIYDLMGRRVVSPQRGKLYIIGGKKIIY